MVLRYIQPSAVDQLMVSAIGGAARVVPAQLAQGQALRLLPKSPMLPGLFRPLRVERALAETWLQTRTSARMMAGRRVFAQTIRLSRTRAIASSTSTLASNSRVCRHTMSDTL